MKKVWVIVADGNPPFEVQHRDGDWLHMDNNVIGVMRMDPAGRRNFLVAATSHGTIVLLEKRESDEELPEGIEH